MMLDKRYFFPFLRRGSPTIHPLLLFALTLSITMARKMTTDLHAEISMPDSYEGRDTQVDGEPERCLASIAIAAIPISYYVPDGVGLSREKEKMLQQMGAVNKSRKRKRTSGVPDKTFAIEAAPESGEKEEKEKKTSKEGGSSSNA